MRLVSGVDVLEPIIVEIEPVEAGEASETGDIREMIAVKFERGQVWQAGERWSDGEIIAA